MNTKRVILITLVLALVAAPSYGAKQADVAAPSYGAKQADVAAPSYGAKQADVAAPSNGAKQANVAAPSNGAKQADVAAPSNGANADISAAQGAAATIWCAISDWLCPPVYAADKGAAPVAHWRFNEGGGATAYDDAGANDGTLQPGDATGSNDTAGEMWTTQGKLGGALECDGTNDYVDCGNGTSLNFGTGNFTIEAWVRNYNTGTFDKHLMGKKAGENTSTIGWIASIDTRNPGTMSLRFNDGTTVNDTVPYASGDLTSILTDGSWRHLVWVVDRSANTVTFYVDGENKGSGGLGSHPGSINNDLSLLIGGSPLIKINANIDDVRIYNYARTAAQVLVDYNAGSAAHIGAGTDPNEGNPPVGYWDFEKLGVDANSIGYDKSGNGNNGTVTGATQVTGKYGSALDFDGTSGSVNIGTTVLNNPTAGTVSMWVYPRSAAANGGQPWLNTTMLSNDNIYLGIQLLSSYKIRAYYWDTAATPNYLDSVNGIPLNSWSFITYSWDSSGSKIYINGSLETSSALTWTNVNVGHLNNANHLGSTNGGTYWFAGKIDDVRIYNYARTPAQIAYDYSKGAPVAHYKFDEGTGSIAHNEYSRAGSGAAPVGWWRLDEGTGTACADSSGNGHTANMTGTASTWIDAKIYKGVSTDNAAASSYLQVSPSLAIGSTWTFEWWSYFPLATFNASWRTMFRSDVSDHQVIVDSSGNLGVYYNAGNGFNSSGYNITSLSGWHHIAAVGKDTTTTFYIDGASVGAAAYKSPNPIYAIGNYQGGSQNWGKFDDVRIYNYARTAEQIYNDYKNTHGTLVGDTKFVDGKIGKALNFDASGDYVDCGSDSSLNPTVALTVETWVNLDDLGSCSIVSKWGRSTLSHFSWLLFANFWNSGEVNFLVSGNGTSYANANSGSGAITAGSWHHIAGVYDASTTKLYINGKLVKTLSSGIPSSLANVSTPLAIGIDYDNGTGDNPYRYFDGSIDDVRIYNYARTAAQVMQDYTAGASRLGAPQAGEKDPWGRALPIAHWKLDENTGVLARDASGNNNDGTLGGDGAGTDVPSWAQGKFGPCLSFDGSDDYVNIGAPVPSTLQIQNAITLEAWIYATQYPGSATLGTIVGCQYDPNAAGYAIHLDGRTNPDAQTAPAGHIHFQIGNGAWHVTNANAQVPLNQWVHIAATREANNNAKVYYNGVLQPSTSVSWTGAITYTGAELDIGRQSDQANRYFLGKIDDVKIYNYARTQAEIAWDYNHGKPVAHYRFNEGSGTTAWDESDNNNDGTITIGATGTQTTIASAWTAGATGKFGKCMSFDGTDDWVSVANESLNFTNNSFTVGAWLKPSASPPSSQCFFGAHTATATDQSIHMRVYSTGQLRLGFFGDDLNTGTGVIAFAEWSYVTMTYDYGSDTSKIYVNGVQKASGGNGPFIGISPAIKIGTWMTTTEKFNGLIDDVRIYNYARTADQILQDYNHGAAVRLGD